MMKKIINFKVIYLLLILLFAIPSIIHIINTGFVLESKEYFHIFINNMGENVSTFFNGLIYFTFFVLMFGIYFLILKKKNKLFNNITSLIIFILLVSVLFAIILPITSSDVFSYATTGEIQSRYNANPYYDKISDIKQANDTSENEILNSITIWDDQLVIYGPLWSLICSIITFFSFSKMSIALILFKVLAIVVHIFNCILIYKITKKKFWVIFYGLNPYILFETISNVHNDLYLVFFALLALYFFINKKNLVATLIFLACATCIKYVTVLLVPILLIYYYRKENISKRILKCIKSGLLFAIFVILMYLIYLRNFEMIFYVLIQQNKYRESILSAVFMFSYKLGHLEIVKFASNFISISCAILYISLILKLLFKKDIKFREIMKSWNMLLLVFILAFISNLCVWYFVWLFATVMWQNSKNIRVVMYLPFIYELLISKYFFLGGEWASETYGFSMVAIVVLLIIINFNKIKKFKIFE